MFGIQMINDIETFQRELDQLFRGGGINPANRTERKADRLSLREVDGAFIVEAALPGAAVEKLAINVLGRRLTVSGAAAAAAAGDTVTWHRQERNNGEFCQALLLPTEVDSDNVEAQYKNGILRITLPKAASALPKQISVKAA
jgi:HSP20 family protein